MARSENVLKAIVIVLTCVLVALISIVKIAPATTNVETHKESIAQIDREIEMVLKLTAGATGASAAISLLPDDQCTPVAEQFAELGKYFMLVLSALYLEKYLISMLGGLSFAVLIPLACALILIAIFFKKDKFMEFAVKVVIAALAIYLVIPISVKTSDIIYKSYESTMEITLDSANQISVDDSDATGVEKFLSWIENAAGTIVDYVTGLLSRFIEAIAVMLVTSCLIPILVVLFFCWLMRILFETSFIGEEQKE